MAELIFFRQNEEMMHVHLTQSVTHLGRSTDNDISFPDSERQISRRHAIVRRDGHHYWLQDLTTQGLQINGSLQQTWRLADGDEFVLGSFRVVFLQEARLSSQPPTLIRQQTESLHSDTLPMMPGTGQLTPAASVVVLSFQKHGRKQEFLLPAHAIQIGGSDEAHLQMSDPYISSLHCRIYPKQGGWYIRDLDSRNGTWVNGVRVVDAELPTHAEIRLGQFPLTFERRTPSVEPVMAEFPGFAGIIGQDPSMNRLFDLIQRMAQPDIPVLIQGESGVGKELVARALHDCSPRRDQPFVALNCGSIPKELVESALFGHEKGAFTGAVQSRMGAFEEAGQGTLFLDEIGDMPLEHQVTLLRVLETGQYRRIGGSQDKQSQARIIAATHQSLQEGIAEGWFREDLFYRLHVLVLDIPPLRSRPQDIPILAQYFLQSFAGHRRLKFSPQTLHNMVHYAWPGNVRELRNTLQRAIVLANGVDIQPSDIMLPSAPHSSLVDVNTAEPPRAMNHLEQAEQQAILRALEQSQGVITEAAKVLGIGRSSLYSKMKKLGIVYRADTQEDKT